MSKGSLTAEAQRRGADSGVGRGSDPLLSDLERHLLNVYQRRLPLSPTPYADMAESLGVSEAELLACLQDLTERGIVSRVGAVFRPNRIGVSTLAAMRVPAARLDEVAALVSACSEVNHNYERGHEFNLWFVATAADPQALERVLRDIERRSGIPVMDLPLEQDFHIDLGFPLWC